MVSARSAGVNRVPTETLATARSVVSAKLACSGIRVPHAAERAPQFGPSRRMTCVRNRGDSGSAGRMSTAATIGTIPPRMNSGAPSHERQQPNPEESRQCRTERHADDRHRHGDRTLAQRHELRRERRRVRHRPAEADTREQSQVAELHRTVREHGRHRHHAEQHHAAEQRRATPEAIAGQPGARSPARAPGARSSSTRSSTRPGRAPMRPRRRTRPGTTRAQDGAAARRLHLDGPDRREPRHLARHHPRRTRTSSACARRTSPRRPSPTASSTARSPR